MIFNNLACTCETYRGQYKIEFRDDYHEIDKIDKLDIIYVYIHTRGRNKFCSNFKILETFQLFVLFSFSVGNGKIRLMAVD